METEVVIIVSALIIGLVLMLLEILTPTFGALVGAAIVAFVVAIWRSFVLNQTLGWTMLVAVIVLVPTYLVLVVKLLPNSRLGRLLFLGEPPDVGSDAVPEAPQLAVTIGQQGIAETTLRPVGAIRIDNRRLMARAERGMINAGATVRVIKAHGSDVIVRAVESDKPST